MSSNSIVGFTVTLGLSADRLEAALAAQQAALAHFDWLEQLSINVGESAIALWGRGELTQRMHHLPDGRKQYRQMRVIRKYARIIHRAAG